MERDGVGSVSRMISEQNSPLQQKASRTVGPHAESSMIHRVYLDVKLRVQRALVAINEIQNDMIYEQKKNTSTEIAVFGRR